MSIASSEVKRLICGVRLFLIVLKNSEYRLDPIFSAPQVRFPNADVGGLVIHARLNGDRSESICGDNQRQSKMSLVFQQICNDFRLATFSTESTIRRHMRCRFVSQTAISS
jgi:hypothetical protein